MSAARLAMLAVLVLAAAPARAQTVSQRGFVDAGALLLPERAINDPTRAMADGLVREEVFVKPADWIQFAAGVDLRANSHDQVDAAWRIDVADRGVRRPLASVRRLSATLTHRGLTVDVGKQFIRWGKTDIVNPTDRFAPRDFLNVITADFLAVTGVRAVLQRGDDTFEGVWLPRFTPSRVPLLDQRWTAVPPGVSVALADAGAVFPERAQRGARWSHIGRGLEYALSWFDGFNHLPNIESAITTDPLTVHVTRVYPAIRSVGADAAMPLRWFAIKGEAAYFASRATTTAAAGDNYVLYVVQLERQTGEWVFVGGYAGEAVTERRTRNAFAPDRGMTRSIVGRASYTIDSRRGVAFESAARQSGDGVYAKAEYSETHGQHWRATVTGVAIAGDADDFLGQYHRNSHLAITLRYSF
jgi:hypothetical protein